LLESLQADVRVLGVVFHPRGGRAIATRGGSLELTNSEVSGNNVANAPGDGAGVLITNGASATISGTTFADNEARVSARGFGFGGHVQVIDSAILIEDSSFLRGGGVSGGAIRLQGSTTATIRRSTFEGNAASAEGGAIAVVGAPEVTVEASTLRANSSGQYGGAVDAKTDVTTVNLRLDGCALLSNVATTAGGAVSYRSASSFAITDAAIAGNNARDGGAIYLNRATDVRVIRGAFCGNEASRDGGAILADATDALALESSAFFENLARNGGAVMTYGGALDFQNNSFIANDATTGGAIRTSPDAMIFNNNLVAFTPRGRGVDVSTPVSATWSAFYQNLPSDGTPGLSLGVGTVASDPLLQRFAADGRCDDNVQPRATSPLVDAGDAARLDPDGSRSDIGAFGGPEAPSLFADTDGDGEIDLYDCGPLDPLTYPGAIERCDGLDNDCEGTPDGPVVPGAPTWYTDDDRDGWGAGSPIAACVQPNRTTALAGDCDDGDAEVHPDVDEVCDGVDNDCDAQIDVNAVNMLTWYADEDSDGYGGASRTITACAQPPGYVLSDADCDDSDAEVSPEAAERCDGEDGDCDGTIDEEPIDGLAWSADGDGDGWGGPGTPTVSCTPPAGFGLAATDCDDADPARYPFAEESCAEAFDANCDGSTGDQDADGDGVPACEDCNDADPAAYPGAPDTPYDGVRADCDRSSDFDADGDGFDAIGWGGSDCDDADAAVYPSAPDYQDGVDNDCDGADSDVPRPQDPVACAGCASSGTPDPRGAASAAMSLFFGLLRRRSRGALDSIRTLGNPRSASEYNRP
jgi:hypothetical protein